MNGRYAKTVNAQGPHLVLVGPPGSGKSTIGKLVADKLGIRFYDFDDDLERTHGVQAGDLVVQLGRDGFQQAQSELLGELITTRDGVLALGGGTPTAPGVPAMLEPYPVVFLDVDIEHLLKREGLITLHPWLLPNPRAHLRRLLEERRPVYTAVADVTIPTSGREPVDIAADVLANLPASRSEVGTAPGSTGNESR